MSDQTQRPLKADEIEALLWRAREGEPVRRAIGVADEPAVADEPLAPGDVDVILELGRAELMIEDLLALREGSVVTLDKDASEPIDLLANGRLVARGEVIVVDDRFCVRICEVIGQAPPR